MAVDIHSICAYVKVQLGGRSIEPLAGHVLRRRFADLPIAIMGTPSVYALELTFKGDNKNG